MRPLTDADITTAKEVLARHTRLLDANYELSQVLKRPIGDDTLSRAFRRRGQERPCTYLASAVSDPALRSRGSVDHAGGVEIADTLLGAVAPGVYKRVDTSTPSEPVTEASAERYDSQPVSRSVSRPLGNDTSGKKPDDDDPRERFDALPTDVLVVPNVAKVDGWIKFAVVSDLHAGAKSCEDEAASAFVDYAADAYGITEYVLPGDVTQGIDPKWFEDLRYRTPYDQIDHAAEILKPAKGRRFHCLGGNHDFRHKVLTGDGFGEQIESRFAVHGRRDIHSYADRGCFVDFGGLLMDWWHPTGGGGQNPTNPPRARALAYRRDLQPHLQLCGHYHNYAQLTVGATLVVVCPCWQNGSSAFGRSLKYAPVCGGFVVHARVEDSILTQIAIDFRPLTRKARYVPGWAA